MSDIDISEPLSDMLAPLNNEQKEFLMNNYTIQTYKKIETIYCEGETPSHPDKSNDESDLSFPCDAQK